jgi:hypothetical protein
MFVMKMSHSISIRAKTALRSRYGYACFSTFGSIMIPILLQTATRNTDHPFVFVVLPDRMASLSYPTLLYVLRATTAKGSKHCLNNTAGFRGPGNLSP